MKPFVELGFMPGALASGNKTIFWWRGNVTKPNDMKKWSDFIRAFVTHLRERYCDVKRVRQQIADSAMSKLELHFTEWSSSYTPADPVHDNYVSTSYILYMFKNCGDAAQSMSIYSC